MKRSIVAGLALALMIGCGGATPPAPTAPTEPVKPVEPVKPAEPTKSEHPWAKFKVGSFAKMVTTSATEVAGKKIETKTEMKQTLLELTADKAVVEMETSMMGTKNSTKVEIPLTATATPPGLPADVKLPEGYKPQEGEEEVTVAGKTLKCKWYEYELEQGGNKTSTKVWISTDVPGFSVKSIVKMSGATNTEAKSELVEFEV